MSQYIPKGKHREPLNILSRDDAPMGPINSLHVYLFSLNISHKENIFLCIIHFTKDLSKGGVCQRIQQLLKGFHICLNCDRELNKTHRPVCSFLTRMLPRTSFEIDVNGMNDVKKVFNNCDLLEDSSRGYSTFSSIKRLK